MPLRPEGMRGGVRSSAFETRYSTLSGRGSVFVRRSIGRGKRSGSAGFGRFLRQARVDGGGAEVASAAVLGEILLVIVFGGVESGSSDNFGDDFVGEEMGVVDFQEGGAGEFLLVGVVVEDDGAVLVAYVGALGVEGGGVDRAKFDAQVVATVLGEMADILRAFMELHRATR